MDTISILGDDIQVLGNQRDLHVMVFKPDDILQDWQNCGRLADGISGIYNSPTEESYKYTVASTIINEIIENSVKYACNTHGNIELITFMQGSSLCVKATNEVSEQQLEEFMRLCRELYSSNLETLLKNRLISMKSHKATPGIGLILLKRNFDTDINFTFSRNNDCFQVTILVNIDLEQGMPVQPGSQSGRRSRAPYR